MKPLPHQQRIIDLNPNKYLLNWECRVGKSLPGAVWVDHPSRNKNAYIICLKKNKKAWVAAGTRATVYTKEEFKKHLPTITNPTAILFDEVHYAAAPLFVKGGSQIGRGLYNILKRYPDCDFMGLSGTMVRNNAWSLHSLLCFIGVYYDWKWWRETFFELKKMPFLRFPAWMPRKDWRVRMQPFLHKHTDIVSLADVVESLPPATERIIEIKQPKYKRPIDEVVTWVHEHRHEQVGKVKEVIELGYRKLILICAYTDQIDTLAKELSGLDSKPIFILDGRTKDQAALIAEAQAAPECYLICQSAMGESWDGWQFGAMVFLSMGHSQFQYTQMLARQRHPKHLHAVETIYLLGGRWDRRIYSALSAGQDFNPHNPLYERD